MSMHPCLDLLPSYAAGTNGTEDGFEMAMEDVPTDDQASLELAVPSTVPKVVSDTDVDADFIKAADAETKETQRCEQAETERRAKTALNYIRLLHVSSRLFVTLNHIRLLCGSSRLCVSL